MFLLLDTFNQRVISRHRSLRAASKAQRALNRAVVRRNGANSYIPTTVCVYAPKPGQSVYESSEDLTDDQQREWDALCE